LDLVWDLYALATQYPSLDPGTQRRAAGTDVDVEHGIQRREDRRRAAPMPRIGAQPTRAQPWQRLRQYVALTCYLLRASSTEPRAASI
jgi:hypothetical protein